MIDKKKVVVDKRINLLTEKEIFWWRAKAGKVTLAQMQAVHLGERKGPNGEVN